MIIIKHLKIIYSGAFNQKNILSIIFYIVFKNLLIAKNFLIVIVHMYHFDINIQ